MVSSSMASHLVDPGRTKPTTAGPLLGRPRRHNLGMSRRLIGPAVAVGTVLVLGAGMFPLRAHLSAATTALVLVIPVVAAVATGGFPAGVVAAVAGFLVYDFVFIPPYYTLYVGAAQNWVALGVYVVVVLLVAQVVARLDLARTRALSREQDARRLFDLSELLVGDRSLSDLLEAIVVTVREAFGLEGVALLLPVNGELQLASSAGRPPSDEALLFLGHGSPPVSMTTSVARPGLQMVALSASGRPVGLLALQGGPAVPADAELLRTYANHVALAVERAQLREEAVRVELLEEVDRLRRSLVGAVSHDLRSPLATIKVSATSLRDPESSLSRADTDELLDLIDAQADRLDRLVANLLDMTRIQAGALELHRVPVDVPDLVLEAVQSLGGSIEPARVDLDVPAGLPPVDADPILVGQVLANLLENAARHAPEGTPITVSASPAADGLVEVAVADLGPGVPPPEQENLFLMFNRRGAGGRAGLGLAIARAFVEAHGQHIWLDTSTTSGARFVFTLPAASAAVRAG